MARALVDCPQCAIINDRFHRHLEFGVLTLTRSVLRFESTFVSHRTRSFRCEGQTECCLRWAVAPNAKSSSHLAARARYRRWLVNDSRKTMAGAIREGTPCAPQPSDSDRLCFLIFRTVVGTSVLGLTALFTVLTVAPLVVESTFSAPPSPPPAPAAPWVLWSEHDAHASRMIVLISSTQALLIGACFLVYRWRNGQHLYAPAAEKARHASAGTGDERASLRRRSKKPKPEKAQGSVPLCEASSVEDKPPPRQPGEEAVTHSTATLPITSEGGPAPGSGADSVPPGQGLERIARAS